MRLDEYKIDEVPPTIYYIPDFISPAEETYIIDKVSTAPKPKWTQLSNRRLQNWGGMPLPTGMIKEKIPEWLEFYLNRVSDLNVFKQGKLPNHVLINEYLPGQGIMPHVDGPLFYPTITTISCGSHTVLEFQPTLDSDKNAVPRDTQYRLLLERRSLVIIQDEMYTNFLHSISEKTEDAVNLSISNLKACSFKIGDNLKRGTRISLTIRHVPKTSKLKLLLSK